MSGDGSVVTEVRAGGGVVWRRAGKDIEVLLVHRPRYDDWSLPKGKADHDSESWRACAEREIEEETGLRCSSGDKVSTVRYRDRHGRAKEVRYYAMEVDEATRGRFRPNDEVDEVVWLEPAKALKKVTRQADADVIQAFLQLDER